MTSLWCLHGNLQLPAIWHPFGKRFLQPISSAHLPLRAVNLWEGDANDISGWSRNFCRQVRNEASDEPQLLMGYSLGGRLAFHAILEDPGLWRGAIIIAAHPGLSNPDQRKERLQNALYWSHRFRTEPWTQLIRDWDAQPVFAGISSGITRTESDFDRAKIARLFETLSIGRQQALAEKLSKLQNPPILFVSGEVDKKYRAIGEELARDVSVVQHTVIKEAGHRVPWENPDAFVVAVQHFINTL